MSTGTTSLATLKAFLVSHYDDLKQRLTFRLGNADMASDAMQEAWLRLHAKEGAQALDEPTVAHPAAYLFRMAFHIAVDDERRAERRLTCSEAEDLLDLHELHDPGPGPARIAEDRQRLRQVLADLEALPQRRRDILLAFRLDGLSREELAARYQISLRTVDRELEKAYAFCVEQMRQV
jgi:RNA polymerase sigma-70 factor (ECF subfamily)